MKDIDIYQWDSGLTIESTLPILFSARGDRDGLVVASKDGLVPIPNQLTAKGRDISAYQIDGARVVDSCHISVTTIAKPSNYVYTETEIDSIESFKDFAVKAIQDAQKQYQGVADGAEKALAEIKEQVKLIEADEQSRKEAETARVNAEQTRVVAETARANTFDSWTAEEAKRTQQETARVVAEQARETSEAQRETDTKTAIANLDSAITKANGKVDTAVSDANAKVDALVDSTKTKTDAQIALAKEATDKANASASKADTATASAIEATAKANEVASTLSANTLKGNVKDTFIHVDDAWPSSLLSIEIEGAAEQGSTTGVNLFDVRKFTPYDSVYGLAITVEDGFICIKGTVSGVGDIQNPSFNIGQYADNSLSGKSLNLKAFDASSFIKSVYGLRSAEEKSIAVVASIHDGDNINGKFLLAVSANTLTAYEPYTGGKPSPSPDYPQEIEVIENPVVKVTGRNFWDKGVVVYNYTNDYLKYNAKASVTLEPGTHTISSNGKLPNLQFFEPVSHRQLTCAEATDGVGAGVKYSVVWNGHAIAPVNDNSRVLTITLTRAVEMTGCVVNAPGTWIQVEYGTNATAYTPYVGTSLPITLPAEHPYLAKLTDGTADTIEVDKDGNVSLVARVGIDRDVREIETFTQGQYYNLKTTVKAFASPNTSYSGGEMCSAIPSRNTSPNREGIYRTWTGVYVKDTSGRTREEIQAEIDKNAPLTIAVKIPETVYPLGKVTVPSLPDSISNVWTEAEVQGKTAIEYTKDVNIAYDKLANAIVASVGGA